ncbi:hypothetical protein [Antiquaquibacter soli]|uniref:DUF3592 domain-containing protein n=1 Tax=Antiquaquibacter soli TaxID=3064523 RepID=A0ABT9BKY4_9MICO|nr:hypothetical protein [Protaetiibacter sp. WY-16]MDO7881107.1 hypothetical protein [Protaetiibacter sp. WY-16]
MSPRTRMAAAISAVALGFSLLLFGPALGQITLSPYTGGFFSRVMVRYTPEESGRLRVIECYEAVVSTVPTGSTVTVDVDGDDSFSYQRIAEIAYPRLGVSEEPAASDYIVRVTDDPPSDSDDALIEQVCGGRVIWVVEG